MKREPAIPPALLARQIKDPPEPGPTLALRAERARSILWASSTRTNRYRYMSITTATRISGSFSALSADSNDRGGVVEVKSTAAVTDAHDLIKTLAKNSRPSPVAVSVNSPTGTSKIGLPALVKTVGSAIRMKGRAISERRNTRQSPTPEMTEAVHTMTSITPKAGHFPGGIDVVAKIKARAMTSFTRGSARCRTPRPSMYRSRSAVVVVIGRLRLFGWRQPDMPDRCHQLVA